MVGKRDVRCDRGFVLIKFSVRLWKNDCYENRQKMMVAKGASRGGHLASHQAGQGYWWIGRVPSLPDPSGSDGTAAPRVHRMSLIRCGLRQMVCKSSHHPGNAGKATRPGSRRQSFAAADAVSRAKSGPGSVEVAGCPPCCLGVAHPCAHGCWAGAARRIGDGDNEDYTRRGKPSPRSNPLGSNPPARFSATPSAGTPRNAPVKAAAVDESTTSGLCGLAQNRTLRNAPPDP